MPDWLSCPEAEALLLRLDGELRRAVEAEDIQLRIMALHLVTRPGKRLRPALLFLASTYGRGVERELLGAAAALELMHAASLYHDDVMDRAELRRKRASANVEWGNGAATLTGTFLFARASGLFASVGDVANRLASAACVTLCTGQLQEVDNAYNLDLTEAARLEILHAKTAPLFELPCHLGARLSQVDERYVDALTGYGRDIGLAFQLADDALDLMGDPEETGKAVGTDIREGVYTVPVLRALRRGDAAGRELRELLMRANLSDDDVREVIRLVRESRTVEEVLGLARARASQAKDRLRALPGGAARRSLERLAEYAVERAT